MSPPVFCEFMENALGYIIENWRTKENPSYMLLKDAVMRPGLIPIGD